jgi:hypothetical protein
MADEDDDLKDAVRKLQAHAEKIEAEQARQRAETARRIPGFLDRQSRENLRTGYDSDPAEVRRRRRRGTGGGDDE